MFAPILSQTFSVDLLFLISRLDDEPWRVLLPTHACEELIRADFQRPRQLRQDFGLRLGLAPLVLRDLGPVDVGEAHQVFLRKARSHAEPPEIETELMSKIHAGIRGPSQTMGLQLW